MVSITIFLGIKKIDISQILLNRFIHHNACLELRKDEFVTLHLDSHA